MEDSTTEKIIDIIRLKLDLIEGNIKLHQFEKTDQVISEIVTLCDDLSKELWPAVILEQTLKPENELYRDKLKKLIHQATRHLNLLDDWVHINDRRKIKNEADQLTRVISDISENAKDH
jgi:hypothetical protein